jgi:nitrite reductase (NO-forming)
MEKLLAERPEYIVFNGAVGALMGPQALQARVGEKVMVAEIFDTVYLEGASEAQHRLQTTLVPAGGATTVELTFQVPGIYWLDTVRFARVMFRWQLAKL